MHHFFRRFVYLVVLTAVALSANADDRITLFDSHITVRSDGTLAVVERIKVVFDANAPRHGIYRDLLLSYTDLSNARHSAAYDIQSVRRDGVDEPWTSGRESEKLRITIGDPDRELGPGSVQYELRYVTDYQLAFDPDQDSLYWNVTGHAAQMPIDQANVVVRFPAGVSDIEFTAMTGVRGSRDRDVRARQQNGELEVQTLETLEPGEGLTIHVRWPAGAVLRPEGGEKFRTATERGSLRALLRAVFGNGLAALGLIALALLGLRRRYGSPADDGSRQQLPPENLSPAAMRWAEQRVVDARSLCAAIVSLADKGRVQVIDSNKGHTGLTLRKKEMVDGPGLSRGEQAVLTTLFQRSDEVRAHGGFAEDFSSSLDALDNAIKSEYQDAFFDNATDVLFKGVAFAFAVLAVWFLWMPQEWRAPWSFFAIAVGTCVMLMWFASSVHSRTPHGEEILRQVRGFKRYLAEGAGSDRHEVPATTERYLASAIALDQTEHWGRRALGGMPPPAWYTGSLFDSEDFASAIAGVDRHLVRGIRTATSPDRRGLDDEGKSGRSRGGRGGEAGGGGGGGGVGGW